jgi:hypothetical protein
MLLMADRGELGEKPEAAIFADTQWEPPWVYENLKRLKASVQIPILKVTAGSLPGQLLEGTPASSTHRFSSIPGYILMPNGEIGMGRRQCTKDYKLNPIRQYIRACVGASGRAASWIGITVDEGHRMKPSGLQWLVNEWPMAARGMRRSDCYEWLKAAGYPAPKRSACCGCPYRSDGEWRAIQADPEAWASAVRVDEGIREQRALVGRMFLHSSCKPLAECRFDDPDQTDWITEECEGMCGI